MGSGPRDGSEFTGIFDVIARLERWTAWAGGPTVLAGIILVQLTLLGVFTLEKRAALGLILALPMVLVVLERPVLGVGLLILARLLSTGATVFFRIGRIGVGPFEPALALCLIALLFHAAIHGRTLWRDWPWRQPYLALMAFVLLSLGWSVDRGDGLSELLPMGMVVANCLVILAFVDEWRHLRTVLWCWVGGCVLVGVLAIATDAAGIQIGVSFEAAQGGGRETGLGQQPNWFAMNLMFIIHTCFGLALIERRRWRRIGLVIAGFFVFVMMLKSGSRGGAYATLIGGLLAAMAHPLFRKWFVRFAVLTVVLFGVGMAFDIGDSAKALNRISSNLTLRQNYRQLNWLTCLQMFRDTWGLGIGAGGYETLLPRYNNYVAKSLYDYPHGIFWQVIAHYGVVGLVLVGWLLSSVVGMARELVRLARGTEAEVLAWTMPAAMLGYVAWSFVEFSLNDKPFWEFLALYTALYLVVKRMRAEGDSPPTFAPMLPGAAGRKASP